MKERHVSEHAFVLELSDYASAVGTLLAQGNMQGIEKRGF
jgi:hypothetical protein